MTIPHEGAARPRAWRFVTGQSRYVADVPAVGALHAIFVRSTEAHADIVRIDCTAARNVDGVRLILTGADFLPHSGPHPIIWNVADQLRSERRALAHDRVRHVGDPVAVVIADTLKAAQRAAREVLVEYHRRPAVVTVADAVHADAPCLYDHWPTNVAMVGRWSAGDIDAAFADAALVVGGAYVSPRVAPLSLEGRAVLAEFDPVQDGLTVTLSAQSPHQVRETIAECLGLAEHRLRVVVPDMGGAFGMKACAYGEEVVLAHLAMRLRASVRWAETRAEAFVASIHGRGEQVDLQLAFSADGKIAGLKALMLQDKGSDPYASSAGPTWVGAMMMSGQYLIPTIDIEARIVVTNCTPTGPYRGFGVPEVNFALERTMDKAARAMNLDPGEIRRRNFVAPEAMPYFAPQGLVLDSGRYDELLGMTLARFDWAKEKSLAEAARKEGRQVGIGLATYAEPTNMGPSKINAMVGIAAGGFDIANVRIEPSGHAIVFTSQTPMGTGVEASLARICADELTMPVDHVIVIHGDTQACSYTAYGSGGSRGTGVGGSTILIAAQKVRAKLLAISAHLLEVPVDTLTLSQGGVQVVDDPTRRLSLGAIAKAAYLGHNLPEGMEPGIEERSTFDPLSLAITYGIAAIRLEVMPATGNVEIQKIVFGHDCGRQITPALVDGQVIGGIAQGIGAALYEQLRYDESGMPGTRSMRDYEMLQFGDMPAVDLVHLETPSPFFPTGAKGVGESGIIPMPAAIANAIGDALGTFGADMTALDCLPITAEKLIDPEILRAFEPSN